MSCKTRYVQEPVVPAIELSSEIERHIARFLAVDNVTSGTSDGRRAGHSTPVCVYL